ncbi:MAG: hypothetical protein IPO92_18030 [Saprospiraceae bacterium]|nr:hypothetical protein [Saprospiraceae bacterium]
MKTFLYTCFIFLWSSNLIGQLNYYPYEQSVKHVNEINDGFVLGSGINTNNYIWTEPTTEATNLNTGSGFKYRF